MLKPSEESFVLPMTQLGLGWMEQRLLCSKNWKVSCCLQGSLSFTIYMYNNIYILYYIIYAYIFYMFMLLMMRILICDQYGHMEYYSRETFFQVNDVYCVGKHHISVCFILTRLRFYDICT